MPEGLRRRLSRNNGGEPVVDGSPDDGICWLHPVRDSSDRKRIARTASDIVSETAAARSWPDFPMGPVVIAHNGTGDLILMLPQRPEPMWWDHETGELVPVRTEWLEPA